MDYRQLGQTGLRVSRLCFGSLTVSSLQADLPVREAAHVMRSAFEAGVNFVDTAELYRNYDQIRVALQGLGDRVIVATKCYAYRRDQMENSLSYALRALDRECIDIFLLHEQESASTLRGHHEALEYLVEAREKGFVRAVGISTHYVAGVEAAAEDPRIQVVHPIINRRGIGIRDGDVRAMLGAIRRAVQNGKGVYGMKALGGGHLLDDPETALKFVLSLSDLAAVAVGMQSVLEVEYNRRLFSGRSISEGLRQSLRRWPRRLLVEDWCQACGECVRLCSVGALYIGDDGRVAAKSELCILCGYCAAVCPEFAIKVI
jgi:aryl-alcohol dehydrogenase-like predicted oxidoreductase